MLHNSFAIIGDSDFINGFKAAGFNLYEVTDDIIQIKEAFNEVLAKGFTICFILESYAAKIADLIEQYQEKPFSIIVPLTDFRKPTYLAKELLRKATLKAVGSDIMEK